MWRFPPEASQSHNIMSSVLIRTFHFSLWKYFQKSNEWEWMGRKRWMWVNKSYALEPFRVCRPDFWLGEDWDATAVRPHTARFGFISYRSHINPGNSANILCVDCRLHRADVWRRNWWKHHAINHFDVYEMNNDQWIRRNGRWFRTMPPQWVLATINRMQMQPIYCAIQ